MSDYHEPASELDGEARNVHRALNSLKEEIEAVDWYHQRVVLCDDAELKAVLAHNRDEEIEHACMTLEWLRRHMSGWNEQLERYLFSKGPITAKEEEETQETSAEGQSTGSRGDLDIGSMQRGEK